MSQITFRQSDLKASRESQRFPQINQKYMKSDIHRQSLKKLNSQKNNNPFPKLVIKNNLDTSLVHRLDKAKQKKLTKRGKLHTEGMIVGSDSFNEIDDSFISLTDQLNQENKDNTMIDFKKKIEQNKQYIKNQIQKKNKQNRAKGGRHHSPQLMKKKRANSSKILEMPSPPERVKKTLDTPINKKSHQRVEKSSIKKKNRMVSEERVSKRQHSALFSDLQVILNNKVAPEKQKQKKDDSNMKSLLEKLQNFKREKSYSSSTYLHDNNAVKVLTECQKIKGEANFHDWNKLDISCTSEISYRKSSFEEELHKVSQYADRSSASLQKYLLTRKQLFKYGFQVFSHKKSEP